MFSQSKTIHQCRKCNSNNPNCLPCLQNYKQRSDIQIRQLEQRITQLELALSSKEDPKE